MGRRFHASFPGECSNCLLDIEEEDEVGYNEDDELCCAECLDEEEAEVDESVEAWKSFGKEGQ